ncbi:pyridoxamine-phosphate oxidase [Streptomyces sp. LBL]|uniref:phenazine biosynthesis FMN-dependent oxidase PhzG n=1 Tax=Streptomyces sp. LBL TaxID=2940562 RepID=UPI002474F059|nr:phenazine biosynthesis FMN-dependent oxidase PhzG [Streptomyces sp. LBL]MDH6622290.1 pyridoxamine-phosphate oxidase [Streptomyces sp. LBL]
MPQTKSNTLSGDESIVLPEFDAPPADPVALAHEWIASAKARGVREPLAVSLATADAASRPTTRVVLIKELTAEGFVFTSHTGSRKGRDLKANPFASVNFYWRETLQQITAAGRVISLSTERSDELFAERPVAAQATTAVSTQSTPLSDEDELHARANELIDAGVPLPRPVGWGGYLLIPDEIQFWQGKASRLHRRLIYTRTAGGWDSERLQP